MIHDEHPFADDPTVRDPVRRFRGRLSAPVTVFTSGHDADRTGLTVSSLVVLEGEPGQVEAVIGPTTDLWDIAGETGSFVIHICDSRHRAVAEVFAGLRPAPGGVFSGLEVSPSKWGPVIGELANRAYCTVESRREAGFSGIIGARIDHVENGDLTDPLVYFRGGYHTI